MNDIIQSRDTGVSQPTQAELDAAATALAANAKLKNVQSLTRSALDEFKREVPVSDATLAHHKSFVNHLYSLFGEACKEIDDFLQPAKVVDEHNTAGATAAEQIEINSYGKQQSAAIPPVGASADNQTTTVADPNAASNALGSTGSTAAGDTTTQPPVVQAVDEPTNAAQGLTITPPATPATAS